MVHRSRIRTVVRTLFAAALGLLVAAPLTTAMVPQVAPLSAELRAYQTAVERGAALQSAESSHGLGLVPEPFDRSALRAAGSTPQLARRLAVDDLPSAYDLRALGRLSPVKDQREYGACWAFAAYGSLESVLMPRGVTNFSEDHMVLNSGFNTGGNAYDRGGNYSMATAYLVRWRGPVNESADAYGDWVTPAGLTPSRHVQEVLYIEGGEDGADTAAIKNALVTYGAVATSIYWTGGSYGDAENSYYYDGSQSANHAVTIVGWDDTFSASRFASMPAGDGAWLVRNSWGASWGDGGYFWVSYWDAYCARAGDLNAVYVNAESTGNYNTIYSHDPLGEVGPLTLDDSQTAWMANVYTATRSQMITAVGLYTHVPGTTYSVYAGGVISDGKPGALIAKGSGTIDKAGYHTVKLSSPRWVSKGSKFAVAVKLSEPGWRYPVAIEYALEGYSSAAAAGARQSYVRPTTAYTWSDLTKLHWSLATANVCLKAYGKNDAVRPTTTTSARGVRRYATATLSYRVKDALPSCGAATCGIQILKSGKLVKSIALGSKTTNVSLSYKWKATLAKGTYYWRVTAKDRAGNTATTRTQSKLVIY